MTSSGHAAHAATLRDYLNVVRRRKWVILQAVVLVPLAAVLFVTPGSLPVCRPAAPHRSLALHAVEALAR